jgi:hypothetical protein
MKRQTSPGTPLDPKLPSPCYDGNANFVCLLLRSRSQSASEPDFALHDLNGVSANANIGYSVTRLACLDEELAGTIDFYALLDEHRFCW